MNIVRCGIAVRNVDVLLYDHSEDMRLIVTAILVESYCRRRRGPRILADRLGSVDCALVNIAESVGQLAVFYHPFLGHQVWTLCGASRIGGRINLLRLRRRAVVADFARYASFVA